MAYVLPITKTAANATGASVAFSDWFTTSDGLVSGDYIMVVANVGDGANALTISPTGVWTRLNNVDSPRVFGGWSDNALRSQIWWAKFTGTLPAAPTVSGNTQSWAAIAFVVRDAPDVTDASWIDVTARTDETALVYKYTVPAVTTTQNECLLITVLAQIIDAAYAYPANLWGMDFTVGRASSSPGTTLPNSRLIVATRGAPNSGTQPTYDYISGQPRIAQVWTIAIRNKTGGVRPIHVTNPPVKIFDYSQNGTFAPASVTNLSTLHTSIAGIPTFASTMDNFNQDGAIANGIFDWFRQFSFTSPAATTGISGGYWALPAATDYTTGLFSMFFYRVPSADVLTESLAGWLHYFADASGNWSVYRFVDLNSSFQGSTIVVHLPDETRVAGSTTPPNLAAITRRGIAFEQIAADTSTRRIFIRAECIQPFNAPLTITGGGASYPITARVVSNMLGSGVGRSLAFPSGQGLQTITMPIRFGDGTRATYVNDQVQAMEYPVPGAVPGYRVTTGRQEIIVRASSADTILLSAGTKGSTTLQKFTVDSASSNSATYGFAGTFFGFDVTAKTGVAMTNATFINCGKIDAKGTSINGSIIRGSVSTTAAVRLENGGSANNVTFTKGAETYAIEIAGTGTVTLENTTFSGYTKPLNILATSGTVTINLALGQTALAYDSAGAAVVFVIPFVPQSVTITNGVAGTRLLIQDITTPSSPVTLYSGVPSSYPHTWTDPVAYVADRDIRVRAAYQSGTSAKIFIDEEIGTATLTRPALSYRLNQQDDAVYQDNAIDGSAVTGITIDDPTMLINVSTSTISLPSIYAYETYWLATAAGIIDEGRIINAVDTANYIFRGGWKIKNASSPSVPLTITGGYMVDAATGTAISLIDTTGGTIFLAPMHVVPYATGSGVTAQDKLDIATATLTAAQTAPIQADIRKVNGYTVDGQGTEAEPWGPV